MTEQELIFKYAGLAMQGMVSLPVSNSPGYMAGKAFEIAEWMVAEAYRRKRLPLDEDTYKSVLDKYEILIDVD